MVKLRYIAFFIVSAWCCIYHNVFAGPVVLPHNLILPAYNTYISEELTHSDIYYQSTPSEFGELCWKNWFEPVNDEVEYSKNLRMGLEKKVDDGPWTKVLSTSIPKNKPTPFKRFIDKYELRLISPEEIKVELGEQYESLDYWEKEVELGEDPSAPMQLKVTRWNLEYARQRLATKMFPANKIIYRFVIENINDHDVCLFSSKYQKSRSVAIDVTPVQ